MGSCKNGGLVIGVKTGGRTLSSVQKEIIASERRLELRGTGWPVSVLSGLCHCPQIQSPVSIHRTPAFNPFGGKLSHGGSDVVAISNVNLLINYLTRSSFCIENYIFEKT